MVANIATQITQKQIGKSWNLRLVKGRGTELETNYLSTSGNSRHKTDSIGAFKHNFDILSKGIEHYGIQPQIMPNFPDWLILQRIKECSQWLCSRAESYQAQLEMGTGHVWKIAPDPCSASLSSSLSSSVELAFPVQSGVHLATLLTARLSR